MLMKKILRKTQAHNSDATYDRRKRILEFVQPFGKRGIEVGALNRPIITRADGDVLYADHLSIDGLRDKYAQDPAVNVNDFNDLVHVDIVTGIGSLSSAISANEKFDYIAASHVLEHIADPIGWLFDCTKVLREGGIIFLVLPDRRFTFDRFRADTTTGELIANYHANAICPTPSQVFEYNARSVPCGPEDTKKIWKGEHNDFGHVEKDRLREALRLEIDVTCNKTYLDCHCSTFTPYSLSVILREIIMLELLPVEVIAIEPTREMEAEFFVALRLSSLATPEQLSDTVPKLDSVKHGQSPTKRLRLRSRPAHALRVLLSGQAR